MATKKPVKKPAAKRKPTAKPAAKKKALVKVAPDIVLVVPKRPPGRQPTPYEERARIIAQVCDGLSTGRFLEAMCREGVDMPDSSTIVEWGKQHPEFARQVAHARERGYLAMAQDIVEIADDGSRDYVMTKDGLKVDTDHIQRSKLRVVARQFILEKLAPAFGRSVKLIGDPEQPLEVRSSKALTREQLMQVAHRGLLKKQ